MMRPAPSHRAWLCAAALLGLIAACGGESSVSVGVPTENNGPVLNGEVLAPSGRLASAPSTLERLANALVARVEALVAHNVFPVGGGVEVRLVRIGPSNIKNGTISGGEIVNRATTETNGTFALRMPTGTDPGTCRFVLEVGNNRAHTLTRAFVDAEQMTINFESEATVRLLLGEIGAGHVALCDLDAGEIRSVRTAVQESPNQAFGETVAAINNSAATAAANDTNVQAAVSRATGQVTPIPPATNTVPPATATPSGVSTGVPTVPVPPTRTNTVAVPPTRTNTIGAPPTRTNTPGATESPIATRTSTATVQPSPPTSTATQAPTNTTAPTNTATTVPTNTTAPTNTPVPTNTTAATNTPVRTNTATSVPATSTATVVPTATVPSVVPQVNLGVVAGTAGFVVDVPATLAANGAQIASISTDIEFDSASLSVVPGDFGAPHCVVDARLSGIKEVVAKAADVGSGRTRLRVGLIGLDNNVVITSGPLFSCRFLVAAGVNGPVPLLNTPEAAGQQAQAIAVDGSDGRIDASAAPATLGLSAGTAAAGATADITATLNPVGQAVAAVSTDIRFDPTRVSVDVEPDCTIAPAAAALGKELVTRPLPVQGQQGRAGLRVGVFGRTNNTALPAGALFSCRFMVESSGPPIPIQLTAEGAAPSAAPVGLLGLPGTITVP